jgi:hypothetical protein
MHQRFRKKKGNAKTFDGQVFGEGLFIYLK